MLDSNFIQMSFHGNYRVPKINIRENQKGQSRMDNPEKLATFGTQNTRRRQTKQINTTQYVLDTTLCKQTQIT